MPDQSPTKALPGATSAPEDLRVRRTRRLLAQALFEMATEKPIEAITVRDLTDRAQVGYATFFRHYASLEELLRSVVDDLLAELQDLLPPLAGGDPVQAGTVVFRHAREHADVYRLLLGTDRSLGLVSKALEVGLHSVQEAYEARPGSRVPLEVAANHFIRSFISLLEWWLENGMPYDPERMGEIYRDLILLPTEAVALQPRRPS
jgi:AcrR family transcriptional regulator